MYATPTRRALLAAALLLVAATAGRAQTLQWGAGGAGGAGTWIDDGTTPNWFTGAVNSPWVAGNTAVFGGTAGPVTVSGSVAGVTGLTFGTTGYTLTGGSLTLTGNTVTLGSGLTATVASSLTGAGGVSLAGGGGQLVLSGTNSYTGDTLVTGSVNLRLASAGALPAGSSLRLANGTLELTTASGDLVRPGGAGGVAFEAGTSSLAAVGGNRQFGVGASAVAAATNTLTWGTAPFSPTVLGFGSANADSTVTFLNPIAAGATARTIDAAGTAPVAGLLTAGYTGTAPLTKTGVGTLQFSGGLTAAGYRFKAGTVILSAGANSSTAFTSVGVTSGDNATLNVSGTANFTQAGDFNVSDVSGSRGVLNIGTSGTVQVNGTSFWGKTAATGLVNLTSGTVNLAGTLNVGYTTGGVGVLTQSGGTINITAGGESRIGGAVSAAASSTSYGYYALSGGALNVGGFAFQVGAYGIGVLDQTGGTVTTNLWTDAARFGGSFGLINVSGGTFTQNSTGNRLFASEGGTGVVNVFPGGTLVSNAGITVNATAATADGSLNLLGGTTTAQFINGVATGSGVGRVYFNGGTVRPRATNATWIQANIGTATVGPAGVTFDTNGFDAGIAQPLTAPTGFGVTTIPVLTGGSGYVGRPFVSITSGGGSGATAVANLTGGAVTSITITSPGNSYVGAPTVTLLGGGATTAATLGTPSVAANAADGGVTKTGTGVLTLSGTNTFTGPLTLSGGTVAVGTINDNGVSGPLGAQAGASGLVFNGGALRYTGGSVTSSNRGFSTNGANAAIFDVSTAATNLTLAGAAPATATGITKVGAGVLTLNFSSLAGYTGTTRANAGVLAAVGTYTTPFAVGAGGRLNATYQAVAPLTVNTLSLAAGSGLDFDFTLGGGGNDVLTVTAANGLTLGTTSLNLYQAGGATAFSDNGTYPLLQYTTGFSGSVAGAFSVANSVAGKVYSVNNNAGLSRIELIINDAVSSVWATDGNGSWGVPGNWSAGVPNSVGAVATFGSAYTGASPPAVVLLDGSRTLGNLIFNNANSYRIDPGSGGTLTIDNGIATPVLTATTGSHTVAVPVALPNPTNLDAAAGATLTLAGTVGGAGSVTKTGAGTVVLGGAASYSGGTAVTAGTLTLTGTSTLPGGATVSAGSLVLAGSTTFNGGVLVNAGTVELAAATPLGGTSSLTVRSGASILASATGSYAGPLQLDLNGAAVINLSGLSGAVGNYGVSAATGATFTQTGLLSNSGGSFVKTGAGTFAVANGGANVLSSGTTNLGASVQAGTLTLAGGNTATYAVAGELDVGDNTPTAGTLSVQSGTLNIGTFLSVGRGNGTTSLQSTVNVSGGTVNALNLYLGFANGVTGFAASPVVNLSGSAVFTTTGTAANQGVRLGESVGSLATLNLNGTATLTSAGDFQIGFGGRGVVNVADTTAIRIGSLGLGYGNNVAANTGAGVVNQTSGSVLQTGTFGGDWRIGGFTGVNDAAAYGSYTLSGGTLDSGGRNFQIGAYGVGVMNVAGGTYSGSGGFPDVGRYAGGVGLVSVSAGTFSHTATGTFLIIGEAGTGVVTVSGGTLTTLGNPGGAGNGGGTGGIRLGHVAGGSGTLNLNGGTLTATGIAKTVAGSVGNVYLNGGTLTAGATNATFLQGLDNVVVGPGGAVINTNSNSITIGQSLAAPAGSGLSSVPLTSGGAGYLGKPVVAITGGGGSGATAEAVVAGGVVTGIVVTNPGINYTSAPTVTLLGGGATTAAAVDGANVLVAANSTTGGLTKTGAGTLTLTGSNTYGGPTAVTAGTLLAANTAGSATGAGTVTVSTGGLLGGTGTVGGPVVISGGATPGTLRAGVTGGTLTLGGGLTVANGGRLYFAVSDGSTFGAASSGASTVGTLPNPSSNNFLNITGGATTIDVGTLVTLDVTAATLAAGSYSYTVAGGAGNQSGLAVNTQSQFTIIGSAGTFSSLSLTGDAAGAVYLNFTFTPVPEPGLLLAVAAFVGLGARNWRRGGSPRTPAV